MYSAGGVTFHEKATFSGNGQFTKDGLEVANGPAGAVYTVGTMEVRSEYSSPTSRGDNDFDDSLVDQASFLCHNSGSAISVRPLGGTCRSHLVEVCPTVSAFAVISSFRSSY